jgi:O-antigen/teichoic acid export membrane protein
MSTGSSKADGGAIRSLFQTTGVVMGARVFGTGLGFIIQLFLVRYMAPTQYGVYVVAMALAGVLSIICTCGFPSVAARFVLHYKEMKEPGRIRGFVRFAQFHIVGVSAVILFTMTAVLWVGGDFIPVEYELPLFVGCVIAPLLAFMRLNGAFSNTARRFYLTYFPDLLARPILLSVGLVGAFFLLQHLTAVPVLLVHLGAVTLVSVFLALKIRPVRQFGARESAAQFDARSWRHAAFPMMVVVLLTAFLADLDMLLLSFFLAPEDIAVFSICIRMMLLVEFGLQSVFQIVTPDLAEARARGDRDGTMAAVRRAQTLNSLFVGAAFLGVLLLGGTVLSLFGPTFVEGKTTLAILVVAQFVRAVFGPVTQLLTVAGEQVHSLLVYLMVLLVLVAGNFAIVPHFGIEGAAVAFCGAVTIGTIFQARAVSKKLGHSVLPWFWK